MTRAGSIGFGLVLLVACGTPSTAQQHPPSPPAPAVDPVVPPSPASIRSLRVEPSHPLPEGAPAALAHFPAAFDPAAPYDLVVFLHGWSGCVNVLMRAGDQACVESEARDGETGEGDEEVAPGWNLGELLSGPQRVVLMPQLAFRRRDGDAGRFADPSFTREWFDSALSELGLQAPRRTVLMPHSAGFETALAWAQSSISIDAILLMDSLYAKAPEFYAWAASSEERRLVSFYTGGSTGRQSHRLARMAERDGITLRVRRVHTDARHALVPSVEGPGALSELFDDSHGVGGVDATDEATTGVVRP